MVIGTDIYCGIYCQYQWWPGTWGGGVSISWHALVTFSGARSAWGEMRGTPATDIGYKGRGPQVIRRSEQIMQPLTPNICLGLLVQFFITGWCHPESFYPPPALQETRGCAARAVRSMTRPQRMTPGQIMIHDTFISPPRVPAHTRAALLWQGVQCQTRDERAMETEQVSYWITMRQWEWEYKLEVKSNKVPRMEPLSNFSTLTQWQHNGPKLQHNFYIEFNPVQLRMASKM